MKTPEEIADEVMYGEGQFNFGPAEDVVIQMIRDAIEADRAQRAETPASLAAQIERDFPTDEPLVFVPADGQREGYFDAIAYDGATVRKYTIYPEGFLASYSIGKEGR